MKRIAIVFLILSMLASCNEVSKTSNASGVNEEKKNDWTYLFDGSSTDGWRAYNGDSLPKGWVHEKGTLKSLGKGGDIGGDIVYGKDSFGEFELCLEWKISAGGNSGIFYHVVEGEQYLAPYYNAPEYQLIDQVGFPEKLEPWQSIAADYAMYDSDFEGALKEVGSWNSSRILFTNEKVEYWLNEKKTVEFVPWSEDWYERKNSGKWDAYPDYGLAKTGLIGLQDHGSFIWFRNIKIRKINP